MRTDELPPLDSPEHLVKMRMADPYPYYAWLRDNDPVHPELGSGGRTVWQMSRHEDVLPLLSARTRTESPATSRAPLNRHVLHTAGAEHLRLRRMINSAFTPRRISGMDTYIRQDAESLLEAVADREQIDLIADFSAPLTFRMICRILGVPADQATPAARAVVAATVLLPSAGISAADRERDERELADFLRVLIARNELVCDSG
ncbi:hypothetical protein [Streptomyces sp. NPDC002952]|uniref:hypothetical protein n=1 Tax=Streptomyces sp. NPDC002952 TaxID=3364673 RepID=UPI0036B8AD11